MLRSISLLASRPEILRFTAFRSRMGRARPHLNGDEGRARSDKTTSVSRVIYRMAEATMFWMISGDDILRFADAF